MHTSWSLDIREITSTNKDRKVFNVKQTYNGGGKKRHLTRIATLNVYSIVNKMTAIQQFINDWRIDVIVITETYVQEEGYGEISIEGMTRACTSCGEKGKTKGGVAIYVSNMIPCYEEYSMITCEKNEIEHCATII